MKIFTCMLGLSFAALTSSHATVLFSENFDSYTSGVSIATAGPAKWSKSNNLTGISADIVQTDTNDYFGAGSGNKMGQISQLSPSGNLAVLNSTTTTSFGLTGQVSFDYVVPPYDTVSPTSEPYVTNNYASDGIVFRIGSASGNGNSAFGLLFKEGSLYAVSGDGLGAPVLLASTSVSTMHSLSMVYNNQSTSFNYDGGSLAAQSMDVYLDGVLVGDDLTHGALAADTAIASLGFIAKGIGNSMVLTMYTDNFVVSDTVVIPEPDTLASLAGLGALLTAVMLRRRKRD